MSADATKSDPHDRLALLADRYLDGVIPDAELAELNAALLAYPAMRDRFVDLMIGDRALRESHRSDSERGTRDTERAEPRRGAPSAPSVGFRVASLVYALAAALLFAAAAVAIYVFVVSNPQAAVPNPQASPAPVATVLDTTGTLIASERVVNPGDEAATGDYALDTGSADLRLTSGVTVTLRGDTLMTVHDPMRADLSRGLAEFDCPPRAHGFVVDLPHGGRIVDRGTRFEVAVDARGAWVRVIAGRVELWGADGMRPIQTGGWRRIDEQGRHVNAAPPSPPALVDGEALVLDTPPPSLAVAAFESDTQVRLVTERRGVTLGAPLTVDLADPGRHERFTGRSAELPAGLRVDSFLVHYDPVGSSGKTLRTGAATLRFDRPIIGLIATDERFAASDPLFAPAGVSFGDPTDRHLEDAAPDDEGKHDTVELSGDRMTLHLTLTASYGRDQLRVLVASSPESDRPANPAPRVEPPAATAPADTPRTEGASE